VKPPVAPHRLDSGSDWGRQIISSYPDPTIYRVMPSDPVLYVNLDKLDCLASFPSAGGEIFLEAIQVFCATGAGFAPS
jgi:hypothetical protein